VPHRPGHLVLGPARSAGQRAGFLRAGRGRRRLAGPSLGIDATFVVSDVYDAAAALPGQRFDIVYTGIGALVWLPDIPRWPGWSRRCLRRAGSCIWSHSYTDGPALEHVRSVQFQHGLGEIVSALTAGPLRIEFLHEFGLDAFGRFGSLQRRDGGTYWLPPERPRVPMIFSLRASLSRVA
jgi:hypothetical protein